MSLRRQLARRLAEINRRGFCEAPNESHAGSATGATLAELLPDGREWKGERGVCWVLARDLGQRDDDGLVERLRLVLAESSEGTQTWWSGSVPASACRDTVFPIAALDIETCGFFSVPVFLIGLLETDGCAMALCQGFARDYGEEAALLEWMAHRLRAVRGVVTFNGRSFDLPYLRDRQRYHRQRELDDIPHLDLLPVARRIWKPDLPDCRLQTLERHLTGAARFGDVPGREIPDVYRTFVDTGNARHIAAVLEHNRRDLLTLMELLVASLEHGSRAPDEGR